MASFLKQLEQLIAAARERNAIGEPEAEALMALAAEREKGRGFLNVAAILGTLGAAVAGLGVILVVASNWQGIGPWIKIAGLVALLVGAHGLGFWIRATGRPWKKTAAALHFLGAGLFLAGIGLISQIFHLDARPPNGVLLWLVAIIPLAVLLRSSSITLMSIFAVLLWAHMEGAQAGSPLMMPRYSFTAHLMIELGGGAALIGFSGLVREREPAISHAMRAAGAILLFCTLYTMGFYRYFAGSPMRYASAQGTALLPACALLLGGAGLGLGWPQLAVGTPWLRNRLLVLLGIVLGIGAVALAADVNAFPRGPSLEFFSFGRSDQYASTDLILTGAAWIVWFLLAFWCVAFGAAARRKAYVNAGVVAVGLGAVTRFFDLIGTMRMTGFMFVIGGLVLLGVGWGMEKWRRQLVARMGGAS